MTGGNWEKEENDLEQNSLPWGENSINFSHQTVATVISIDDTAVDCVMHQSVSDFLTIWTDCVEDIFTINTVWYH